MTDLSPSEALRRLADAAATYSPREEHDWRCEYRTDAVGWKPGDPPVIRCECGRDELDAAIGQAEAALAANPRSDAVTAPDEPDVETTCRCIPVTPGGPCGCPCHRVHDADAPNGDLAIVREAQGASWQGGPSGDDIEQAIAIVEDSRLTHVHWAEWRRNGGTGDDMAGDLQHHEQAIADYDKVLAVLREARAASASVPPFGASKANPFTKKIEVVADTPASASVPPLDEKRLARAIHASHDDGPLCFRCEGDARIFAAAYAAETPEQDND